MLYPDDSDMVFIKRKTVQRKVLSERKKQRSNFERRDQLAKRFSANVSQREKKIAKSEIGQSSV
jgi:hypothetical protein